METIDSEMVSSQELTDIVPVGDLPALEKRIESGLAAYQRILKMAIKYTHAGDWVDQGGIPYLMSTGAERIARPFGIYVKGITLTKENRNDAKGDYYIYLSRGTVGSKLLDAEIEFEGTCSSRDKFFAQESKWEERDGKRVKVATILKPIEDVDETGIRKKAYTNMFINGVTRLLGLRRLKWEFLQECGIKKGDVARVEFGGKGATEAITDPQKKMLYAKLKGKEITAEEFCKQFNVKAIEELPKGKMNDALAWIDNPGPPEDKDIPL